MPVASGVVLIKQHLRIKAFYGTSENAVKTQIWIAISVYGLVAIMNKKLKIELSLCTILQILSVTFFEKIPILRAFLRDSYITKINANCNQLNFFNLNRTREVTPLFLVQSKFITS
jgi:hypothetical protein